MWKTRQFDDILLRQCNAVYSQNRIERWTKGCILPFPKKGDLGLAKNYRGITLTSIAAKIYNALLRNRIEPKIDNILRKNQNGFRRNRSTTSQILTIAERLLRELIIFPNIIDFMATEMNYETIALTIHNSESFYLQLWGGLFLVLQDSWCLGLLDVWDEMA